jgi:type III secretion system OrgA/MxiK family protein
MLRRIDALSAILRQPLDYLHPHRGMLPSMFEVPAAREVVNQALLRGLGLSCFDPQQIKLNPWGDLWVTHWQRLPSIARLMGAQLSWPQLARGARMRELDTLTRAFARINLGSSVPVTISKECGLEQSLSVLGLGALVAWHPHIPEALMQRLFLQFSPRVVELQQALPAQIPNLSLFILAVQHARIHQNPC